MSIEVYNWKVWKVSKDWTVHYLENRKDAWILQHIACLSKDGMVLPGKTKCTECGCIVPDEVYEIVRKELECP